MSSPVLRLENVTLTASNGNIVSDLSFELQSNEIIAFTGKSGSGKSSVALAILGILPEGIRQTSGEITFFHKDGSSISQSRQPSLWANLRGKHIAFIPQDVFGAFDPVIRMGKQMIMIITERSKDSITDPADSLRSRMTESGLEEVDRIWESYPHQLSGGQLQRCLLCLSLVLNPEILIADEPTSAIDKINQVELLTLLADMRTRHQTAILCITHEPLVVSALADKEISLESIYPILVKPSPQSSSGKTDNPVLEVSNLSYTHQFGGLAQKTGAGVEAISFELKPGQCLGIVGESGSGKSTIAQLLVGMLVPSSGEIILYGKALALSTSGDLRLMRSKVQLVMQDGRGSLHPYRTIRKQLREVIVHQQRSTKNREPDLLALLRDAGLPEQILDRRPGQLSGGECLRVNLVRALLMEPAVLICDESTSALDPPTRDSIVEVLLAWVSQRNMALILISHDGGLITRLANQVVVISEGKILERGSLDQLLTNPENDLTRKLFSSDATL
jgi:peptide/nickel transport system ATP-binding protein